MSQQMTWISTLDHLPEFNQKVLAFDSQRIYIAFRREELEYNEHWVVCANQDCNCAGCTAPVLFWMSLPELPYHNDSL